MPPNIKFVTPWGSSGNKLEESIDIEARVDNMVNMIQVGSLSKKTGAGTSKSSKTKRKAETALKCEGKVSRTEPSKVEPGQYAEG